MNRDLLIKLLNWKNDPARKPLILMGARQVGKTTLLKAFGKQAYQTTVYLNFELEPSLGQLFEATLKPADIIRALEIERTLKIDPLTTLIIFDEIQECPSALNSLKYFCELAKEYAICAAGSLCRRFLIGCEINSYERISSWESKFLTPLPTKFFRISRRIK